MRVGILSQWFAPETGPASLPGVLARELANRGHQVRVLTGFPNYPTGALYDGFRIRPRESSWHDGYGMRRVALYPDHSHRAAGRIANFGSFAVSAAVLGVSALKGVDVIWVYNSPATVALPMWLAQARFKAPVVLHNMDMWPDSLLSTGFAPQRGQRLLMGLLNQWVDQMYRSARYVAVLTPEAGEELKRRGVDADRIALAPTWIDESVFHPVDGTAKRAELGYGNDDLLLGYAGALGRAQGVASLAETVAGMPGDSKIRLIVLGAGTEEQEIARIASQSQGRVAFVGHVPHEEVGDYIAAFDYAYVGLANEGNNAWAAPSKIPSLLACGKPIVGCLVGDSAALIEKSGAGVVVPPLNAEAMRSVLTHISENGRSAARQSGRAARSYYETAMSTRVRVNRVEELLVRAALT